jgi:hypothetical protein
MTGGFALRIQGKLFGILGIFFSAFLYAAITL